MYTDADGGHHSAILKMGTAEQGMCANAIFCIQAYEMLRSSDKRPYGNGREHFVCVLNAHYTEKRDDVK